MIHIKTSTSFIFKKNIYNSFYNKFYFTSLNKSNLKTKLIQTSIKYIPKYGWTHNSIISACQQLNISPASHRIISTYNIIQYLMNQWNIQSLRQINDTNFGQNKRIRHKMHYAIKTRLSKQIPFIDTWHQAMAIGAHPSNIIQTKNLLWQYSDQVWFLCGDKSTDYNYYTKRILFNSAYAATQLHLLTDKSHEKFATWEFLQRRLDDVENLGITVRSIKTVFGSLGNGLLSVVGAFSPVPTINQVKNPIIKEEFQPKKQQKANNQKEGQQKNINKQSSK